MRIEYSYLKKFLVSNESQNKLSAIFTDLGFECEVDGNCIDFDLTPNRGDAFSLKGLARDYWAFKNQDLYKKSFSSKNNLTFKRDLKVIKEIDTSACKNYHLLLLDDVVLKKSLPKNIKSLLESAGIPLIHPLVDLGNFVMLEQGTPLHVFDRETLSLPISVGFSVNKESLEVIGNEVKEITKDTLTIRDQSGAIAIAGIIGGADTAVSDSTKSIAIEAAFFSPESLMNKARQYGLSTDASTRFERGVDPSIQAFALERYLDLLEEIASFKLIGCNKLEKKTNFAKKITLDYQDFESFAGVKISKKFITRTLKMLGFIEIDSFKTGLTISTPSHRFDMSLAEDLYEEILRHYGYDNLPVNKPKAAPYANIISDDTKNTLRLFFINRGYQEVMHIPFTASNLDLSENKSVKVANPLNSEESLLRSNLLQSLISAVEDNLKRGFKTINLFEIGRSYKKSGRSFSEEEIVSGVICRSTKVKFWDQNSLAYNFFNLKKEIQDLLKTFGIKNYEFILNTDNTFFNENSLMIKNNHSKEIIGSFGEINNKFSSEQLYGFSLLVDKLLRTNQRNKLNPVSKFPFSERDLNIVLDKKIDYSAIESLISKLKISYLRRFELIDIFSGKDLQEDQKSLTIRFSFQSLSRSLKEEEVNQSMDKILRNLSSKLSAKLRK